MASKGIDKSEEEEEEGGVEKEILKHDWWKKKKNWQREKYTYPLLNGIKIATYLPIIIGR